MLIKEIFEEEALETPEPVELLLRMNRRLHRVLPEGMYAAAVVLTLSFTAAKLELASAGLPYPFVLRARKRLVEKIDLSGFPLGLFAEIPIPYEVRSIHLSRGDVLLVGSDGIHTVAGKHGDFFEDERLPRLLAELVGRSGEDVIQRLADETLRFGNGEPLPDDLNLLAITRA
jgi:serine phosphatase RsbU (regulator of sigma subunit)